MPNHNWQKLLLLIVFLSGAAVAQRLPNTVLPEHYQLSLDIDIQGRKFSGEETVRIRVTQPVSEIVVNSLDLEITFAEVKAGTNTQPATVTYDKTAETARLTLPAAVPVGEADLHIKFSAPLTEGLRGLYLSKTSRRMYAVTQFEGTYARMMFPCFDEPSFKATFDLSVIIDAGDTAISNGRIIQDEAMGKRHKLIFSTSPRMSTYLVALAVGDWQCQGRTVSGIPIRVCATPERKSMTGFALDVATHSLEFYDHWYGIKYPFGKLDMLAIPDYEWGGMENTASIFYRDTALLLDEKEASASSKRGHATVIAHEMAHQWFGDLVTAAWWDDIWLNEGFATWMERKPIEQWHPEWHLDEDATAEAQSIIAVDSLASALAIHGDPKTSSEIKEMFDGITYEKGGAVLRMLEAYVGPEVFRRGVNQYLQEHANGNATSADFWQAMTRVSGKPIDKIMTPFVMQPGVPLVTVNGTCRSNSLSTNLQQQRFYVSPQSPQAGSQSLWQIPICIRGDHGQERACTVLEEKSQEMEIKGCPEWIFANPEGRGYYRVAYDQPMLEKIALAAESSLQPAERIALVEDAWAMTRAGKYPVEMFMNVAKGLRTEHDLLVVGLLAPHLSALESLVPKEQREAYQAFLRAQFNPLARELGWEAKAGESDQLDLLRATLLQVLGDAGDPDALSRAQKIVAGYLAQPGSTDPTLTRPAFAVAAVHGDPKFFETLISGLPQSRSSDQYYLYLYALTAFRDPALVQRSLDLVTQGKLRQQDYAGFFSGLLANPTARDSAWAYLKTHWSDLAEKVVSFGGRGAVSALGAFCSADARNDIKSFFSEHRAPGAERAVKQSLERIDSCLEFRELQQANMRSWLQSQ